MPRFFFIAFAIYALAGAACAHAQTTDDPARLDRLFSALSGYKDGGDAAVLDAVTEYVDRATARYKIRVDAEARLLKIIQSRQTSAAAKKYAATQLYRLCDEDTIPAFRDLLLRKDTAYIARKGLEDIDDGKAQAALLEVLGSATGSTLVGLIETLGVRAQTSAVAPLHRLAISGNVEVTQAALTAMANISGREAMEALDWCRVNLTSRMRPAATDAYIQSGWTALRNGDYATAIETFDVLLIEIEPIEIRAQGLRGVIRAQREKAVPTIIEALNGGNPVLRDVAAEEAGKVPGKEATAAFNAAYADVTTESQILLLDAFAERGDEDALPTILIAAKSRLPGVRLASLKALSAFNHPDTVQALLKGAAIGSPEEKRIARDSLARLSDPRINEALVKAAMSADNGIRFEAIKCMVARRSVNAVPVLLRMAERDVRPIRLEALRALGKLGSAEELPFMADMLLETWDQESRESVAKSITAIAVRSPDAKNRTKPITDALRKSSSDPEMVLTLIEVLAQLHDDNSLFALEDQARRTGVPQRRAVEVLATWPNDSPIDTLERVASTTKDAELKHIAFAGFMRQLSVQSPDRAIRYYQRAVKYAETPEHKLAVVKGLATLQHRDTQKLLERYLDDPEVGEDAARAHSQFSATP